MSSPAEPHITPSGQIPLTACALGQLDAQMASSAEEYSKKAIEELSSVSSSKMQDHSENDSNLRDVSTRIIESHKSRSNFESEISKGKMRLPSAESIFFLLNFC